MIEISPVQDRFKCLFSHSSINSRKNNWMWSLNKISFFKVDQIQELWLISINQKWHFILFEKLTFHCILSKFISSVSESYILNYNFLSLKFSLKYFLLEFSICSRFQWKSLLLYLYFSILFSHFLRLKLSE